MTSKENWLNLPNKITFARLLIAVFLFILLSIEITGGTGDRPLVLNLAAMIFILCVATDWLDGHLARKYGLVTAFGRIADPFVDKVVVCGSLIYLVHLTPDLIRPWFVATLVAREFLVSGLRAFIESRGTPFGARWGGKIKMILQSILVPLVLVYQANFTGENALPYADLVRNFCWLMVVMTLLATIQSAWDYVSVALGSLNNLPEDQSSKTVEGREQVR